MSQALQEQKSESSANTFPKSESLPRPPGLVDWVRFTTTFRRNDAIFRFFANFIQLSAEIIPTRRRVLNRTNTGETMLTLLRLVIVRNNEGHVFGHIRPRLTTNPPRLATFGYVWPRLVS